MNDKNIGGDELNKEITKLANVMNGFKTAIGESFIGSLRIGLFNWPTISAMPVIIVLTVVYMLLVLLAGLIV